MLGIVLGTELIKMRPIGGTSEGLSEEGGHSGEESAFFYYSLSGGEKEVRETRQKEEREIRGGRGDRRGKNLEKSAVYSHESLLSSCFP